MKMIGKDLLKEIQDYCSLNKIEGVDELVNKMLNRGFAIEKYGETPTTKVMEPEVIETIVEVEKVVEKIVEVIKEVPVEKIVQVSDDAKISELLKKIEEWETKYNEDIDLYKDNVKRQTQQILKLNKEKDELTEKYEARLKEQNNESDQESDIYDEEKPKKGFLGSNIQNIRWPNKQNKSKKK